MGITVTVVYLGHFVRLAGVKKENMALSHGSTVRGLIDNLKSGRFSGKEEFFSGALITRNRSQVTEDAALADGDRIVFMSPVIGGG
jgi:molybdopterin converting factor small subunit